MLIFIQILLTLMGVFVNKVSIKNEGTSCPFWTIIDPKQNTED